MEPRLERAVTILRRGGVVAYPTDTLYGLAVDPRSADAVAKLFSVKARDPGHAIPLIAADAGQVDEAAVMTPTARRLAEVFWPGPLSLILESRPSITAQVCATDGSVAIRIPASDVARALATGLGFCITSTSANLSGEPPSADPRAVWLSLGDLVDDVLDAGRSPGGPPSTIVDARGPGVRLVRAGAVAWERVLESLQ
jgi:L-threonylcarbamoyladenylate synthase